jgi:hypothetical protein
VEDSVAVAHYIVKDLKDTRKKELPPENFRGRVFSYSRGFFSDSLKNHWKKQRGDWYPNNKSFGLYF